MRRPSPAAPRPRTPPPGLTLVEIATVIVIVGILTAVALPRLPLASARADAAVRIVRGELQAAQRLAITRQSDVVVGIDASANRLRVHEDGDNDGTVDAGERVRVRPLEEGARLLAPPVAGIRGGALTQPQGGTNLRDRDGLPSITFRRDGSASSDLELYVAALTAREDGWRGVVVTPSTGRVEAWRLAGTEWRRMRP